MSRVALLAGLGGMACGVFLAWVLWLVVVGDEANVAKTDEPDEQIVALEQAYQTMLHNRAAMNKAALKSEVIMFTRPGCVWCDRWLSVEAPKFKAAGYSIAFSTDHYYGVVPVFEVSEGQSKKMITGYFTYESWNAGR